MPRLTPLWYTLSPQEANGLHPWGACAGGNRDRRIGVEEAAEVGKLVWRMQQGSEDLCGGDSRRSEGLRGGGSRRSEGLHVEGSRGRRGAVDEAAEVGGSVWRRQQRSDDRYGEGSGGR